MFIRGMEMEWLFFRRHLEVALLMFALTTAGAFASFSHLAKTYQATVRLVSVTPVPRGASDEDAGVIRQAQASLTDEDVLALQRRFHLYPTWLLSLPGSWVIDGIRSKLSFSEVNEGESSLKQLSVSFTDRSRNRAREVTSAIAADLSSLPASADGAMLAPSVISGLQQSCSPDRTSKQAKSGGGRAVLTRHVQILQHDLETAHQQETMIQSGLEKTGNEWAHVHRELVNRANVDASPGTVSRLNQQRAKLEPEIISLQKALEANRSQQHKWRMELAIATATLASDLHEITASTQSMPYNASLRGERGPSLVSFNLATNTSVEVSEALPSLYSVWLSSLGLGFAVLLATMFVLNRRDGIVTRYTDLSKELSDSIIYLGDIPRIKL
jgi:hypothetical protein